MAGEWRQTTWGAEISLEYGKALRGYGAESSTDKYRVYGTNGPIGWTAEPLTGGPGVILGRKGAYRGVHYSEEPFFVIDTAYYVVPKTALDMRWLFYAIQYYRLGSVNDGSPIPSTTRAAVYPMELMVPHPDEQRAIAAILGSLDDKIESNRRTSRALERVARALFRAWFVDFEPVKAKGAGARAFPGMPAETFAALPSRLVPSELGPIPEGWRVGRLDDAVILQRGFDLPASTRTQGKYPVIAASGPNGCHDRFMVHGPGVTTGRSGVLGKVFFIHGDFWPLNTSLWIKEFKSVTPAYAFHLLRRLDLGSFNSGSAVPTLNRNHVHNLPVVIPPEAIVKTFDSVVMPLMRLHKYNDDQARSLATLRDYLLPKLLSGAVRSPAWQEANHGR